MADTDQARVIYVIDDDPDMLSYLSLLLSPLTDNLKCYSSAAAFLNEYDPYCPAILLCDVVMPDIDGLELQRILQEREISLPLILMSAFGNISIAKEALKKGAEDFLEKPINSVELVESVKAAMAKVLQGRVVHQEKETMNARLACLTGREHEILDALMKGESNKQLADVLGISQRTVETHRSRILKKMHVHSFPDLVRMLLSP
ncbi:response regulator transcription factor [Pseudomonadota bacterium]